MPRVALLVLAALAACAGVQQRFPDEVQQALATRAMRRAETDHFIIYYPDGRVDELARFVQHAERCVDALRDAAVLHDGPWADKMVVVMPEVAFDNAFVVPDLLGDEAVALIPTYNTLDFATEFGLPPDPGYIACHELTHYVHGKQIAGVWRGLDKVFGALYSPQVGFDPWFFEGLATHYETALDRGVGRPQWPIFTGMFAAAYAGTHVSSGELSQYGRLASVGHHYLVGTMFVRFLAETIGERALWQTIASQARSVTGLMFPLAFGSGAGVSFGTLLDRFDGWVRATFPVRARPDAQRALGVVGNDARYARGRDGTEAWVADDVDLPPRLVVRDPRGAELARVNLVDIVPPRTLVQADPLLVSGLSVTANGDEVWLTVIDYAATAQIPRLLRWRRGESRVTEVARDLGPGATISPRGDVYYYCAVDGDRWSLAAYDTATGTRRVVRDMAPGTYILGAQPSPDGARVVTNTFDRSFFAQVLDATTGAVVREIRDGDRPVYDASFLGDGRVMWLGEIAHRFQVVIEGVPVSDAPYAALAPREANGTIRFLDREGWNWELAEIATPPTVGTLASGPRAPPAASGASAAITAIDQPYCPWEHFFFPQERSPTVLYVSSGAPHVGAVVAGGDRLGEQRWSIAGYAQPPSSGSTAWHYAGDVSYLNEMLAPFQILADVDAIDWVDPVAFANGAAAPPDHRRERDATLALARTWRGSVTAVLAGLYTDDFDQLVTPERRHLGGPQLALAYDGVETTRYTGPRRALYATATAAFYPHAASTFDGDITDVGGSLGVVAPMPWGRRHTLALAVRGRALIADADPQLLQLGGDTGLATLFSGTTATTAPPGFDPSRFPPNLRFIEPLRGYEDFAIPTDRTAIADVTYRYPLIVDRGVAATLWWFPATYLRQLDLELFAAGAIDRAVDQHAAAGFAITARFAVWRFPLVVTYQLARRLRDDDAIVQLVGVGPDT